MPGTGVIQRQPEQGFIPKGALIHTISVSFVFNCLQSIFIPCFTLPATLLIHSTHLFCSAIFMASVGGGLPLSTILKSLDIAYCLFIMCGCLSPPAARTSVMGFVSCQLLCCNHLLPCLPDAISCFPLCCD